MVNVREATAGDLTAVRALFLEYAASLDFKLCFQNFDEELASLPGDYTEPDGCLLIACDGQTPVGCVALRPLEPGVCEMKRLYVVPQFRSNHVGRLLTTRIIEEARLKQYRHMRLDTVPSMAAARSLYTSLGFQEIPPYRHNPIDGALFMEKDL